MKKVYNRMMLFYAVGVFVIFLAGANLSAHAVPLNPPLTADDFEQSAPRGFGDQSNSWAQSMAWWKGMLFVGTARQSVCTSRFALWNFTRLTVDEVFADTYLPYPPPDPDLSCVPEGADLPLQAEIWRWTPEDDEWIRVYQSPLELDNPGPGDPEPPLIGKKLPYEITFRGITPHVEPDGTEALYAFGVNSTLMWDSTILPPPRILRSTDGLNFEPLPQTPGTFLGDLPHNPDHSSFRSPESYNDKLFVISGPIFGQGSLIVSEDPAKGDNAWSLASPPELMFYEMQEFNGWLYLGTLSLNDGYSVVKTRAQGSPPYDFITVIPGGAGLLESPSRSVVSMHEHKGQLYVGTATKTELIRINPDDTWELVVGEPRSYEQADGSTGIKFPASGLGAGFGQSVNDHAWKMLSYDGSLYIGTYNVSTWYRDHPEYGLTLQHYRGAHLYRTENGWYFNTVTNNGFTDPLDPFGGKFDYGFRTMVETPHGVFLGTANDFYGLGVFRGQHTESTKPVPPERVEVYTTNNEFPLLSWLTGTSPETASYQVWRAEVDIIRIREELNYANWDFTIDDGNLLQDTLAGPYEKIADTNENHYIDTTEQPGTAYLYYILVETPEGGVSNQSNLVSFPQVSPSITFNQLLIELNRRNNLSFRTDRDNGNSRKPNRKRKVRKKVLKARFFADNCQLGRAARKLDPDLVHATFNEPDATNLEIIMSKLIRRLRLYELIPGVLESDEFCEFKITLSPFGKQARR